jgi:hypothetical protein
MVIELIEGILLLRMTGVEGDDVELAFSATTIIV